MNRCLAWLTAAMLPFTAFGQSTGGLPALREDLAAETNRAVGRESQLQNAITQEAARAQAAEQAISSSLTQATGNIDAEATRAKAAEAALQAAIDAESARAKSAESTLDGKIQSETTQRVNADSGLASDQAAETAARTQGDVDTLAAAKAHTNTSVAAETGARKQGDVDTLAAAKAYADSKPPRPRPVVVDWRDFVVGDLLGVTITERDYGLLTPTMALAYATILIDGNIWRVGLGQVAGSALSHLPLGAEIFYESEDCSGTAYAYPTSSAANLVLRSTVKVTETWGEDRKSINVAYVPMSQTTITIVARSTWVFPGDCATLPFVPGGMNVYVTPAKVVWPTTELAGALHPLRVDIR